MSERPHSSTEDQAPPLRQIGDLSGQVAVVTGSTSGIGLALARAVAAAGGDVVLNGLGDKAEIERTRADLAASYGRRVLYHPADMTNGDQIADMVAFSERELGRLDILVNNAGIQHVEAVESFPTDQWEKIIAINLSSAFYATRAAIPIMKAQGRGRIVNIASAHGLVASPFKSAYVAAKHGIIGFTKTVALELARDNITCNAICPGTVDTPSLNARLAAQGDYDTTRAAFVARQPIGRLGRAEEIADLVVYLAGATYTTGQIHNIDGGWSI